MEGCLIMYLDLFPGMETCLCTGHLAYIQQKKRALVRERKTTETLLTIIMHFRYTMNDDQYQCSILNPGCTSELPGG